jgi:hypothetical protein
MQERPLNTDDLAGAQGAGESTDPAGRPADAGTQPAGQPVDESGADRPIDEPSSRRPDLSVVQGGGSTDTSGSAAAGGAEGGQTLLPPDQASGFHERWQDIQVSFVDEPRQAVEQADLLVADLLQRLAASFSDERKRLEGQWDRGGDVSTEDLRVALQRYRSFFDRLLAA